MQVFHVLRLLVLAMATMAYLANGAQAHVKISQGETLELMLCGTGEARAIELHLPGEPAQETKETCCGDCAPSSAIPYASPNVVDVILRHELINGHASPERLHPRSPLWPGAPPIGPPITLKANV